MNIYSGDCEHGECGKPAGFKDSYGQDLFVGDIVTSHSADGTLTGLSVVVDDRPNLVGRKAYDKPFVMGLASIDFEQTENWFLRKIKRWEDCIPGEHWKDYGFNYREA